MQQATASGRGPAGRYQALVDAGKLSRDPAQAHVMLRLQRCHDALVKQPDRWFRRARRVRGIYLHGGVGRGKTLLMDLFAQSLNDAGVRVERSHFHRFMDGVHAELSALQGRTDPLAEVAARLRKRARVLCFDEFHVEDIADAMLLGELSRYWFELDMTLVATSNQPPEKLYEGGLQRARLLPAIANIERHCEVVELDAAADYRLRELERHPTWYTPCEPQTERRLSQAFAALSPDTPAVATAVDIRGRKLRIRCRAGSLVWADFDQLCEGPRSAADYIELALRFSTLIVSNIPQLDDDQNNAARRLIHLVDECYEHSVKLIASSEAPIEQVYVGKRLAVPFQRTVSRLVEMQSVEYLARPHRP
ncbi:MAG: cell division protein ZapE [Gammaproteobacteria bacterium HGW-Gammaproteobacteria-8]|nr:MAG: cell division protein ZapE [Gammaproteobacteria bacterium HGW-Gammaproteobacteria-8]